jgi:hypothetical protein
MDGQKFDDVARLIGTATSRRAVMRTFAAIAIGVGFGARRGKASARTCRLVGEACGENADARCCTGAVCNEDQPGGGFCSCPQNLTNCRGFCVNVNTDPAACGANCEVCPDDTDCCNGTCCPAGQRCCGGVCKDLTSDHKNCGGCTQACPADLICCGSRCRLLGTDQHCGACGFACGKRRTCVEQRCDCRRGYTDCGDGHCRNLKNDPQNCGRCGRECESGRRCRNGRCRK